MKEENAILIPEKLTINVSWLNSHDYCEYKWYLENVLKEEMPIVMAMVIGKQIHKVKENEFRKVAKPTTPKEFFESKFYTITKEIFLKKEFDDFILVGKIDELGVDADNLYVIDDKPKARSEPYLGIKRQIWAYCILVREFVKENCPEHLNKKVFAVLRDRDSNREVWSKELDERDIIDVLNAVSRMVRLFKKEIEPIPNKVSWKCRSCVLHKAERCKFSCG